MYTRYFGFIEKPFAIAPNPRFFYMSDAHREALAHLLYGINGDGCIILFTGGVGTGKTTVCRCCIEQLPETTDVALVLNPKLTIADLLKTICEELGIEIFRQEPTNKDYIDGLNAYLLAAHAKGRNTAVIIDEAQNLDIEVLEQLRLLTNLETDTQKLLQIVLIGQPELRDILSVPALSQVSQRITTRYHLEALQLEDVSGYIHHRLALAGGDTRTLVIPENVIRIICKHSRGIPRLINIICDRALLGAYAENKVQIDAKTVKKAIREVLATARHSAFGSRSIIVAGLCLILLLVPLSLYFVMNTHKSFLGKEFAELFPDKMVEVMRGVDGK
ncbi:MAG: type II secretory pathway protein ExeA [Desulfotalea sp.]|nr:MAG: type II secretory pathway protein ExeA [Desulfotalea sp.]